MKTLRSLTAAVALTIALAFALAGCPAQQSQTPADKVVAEVGGDKIVEKDLQRVLKERVSEHMGREVKQEALRAAVIDQIISETLLLQGAKEAGINPDMAAATKQVEDLKKQIGEEPFKAQLKANEITEADFTKLMAERTAKEAFANTLFDKKTITADMVRKYYKQSPKPFLKPETITVRFLEAGTKEDADKLMAELQRAGTKGFDAAAARIEKEKRAFVSGYGTTEANMYSGDIREGLKNQKPGTLGGPYKGKEGYFIMFLKARTPEKPKSLQEATPEIEQMLFAQGKAASVAHWIAERKKKSVIKTY